MAELVPIKSFACPRGSKPERAKPGHDSQSAYVAPFAARDYVRKLKTAPDGSRITSTEKNVATQLAHHFNPGVGIAWPSMKALAEEACISVRHCRRAIESLERKKVIQRIHMRRADLGGQTSNEYFFPALGAPLQSPEAKARRLEIQKVPRAPMTRVSGKLGRMRPTVADSSVRLPLTNATGGPGHRRPPIESLGDCLRDLQGESLSEAPAVRIRAANLQPPESQKTFPTRTKAAFAELSLARTAWDSALQKVRSSKGAKEIRRFRFRDVTVVSVGGDGAGIIHLTLRSPAPEKAEAGIAAHGITLGNALGGFYGCAVKLRVVGNEFPNAPPD